MLAAKSLKPTKTVMAKPNVYGDVQVSGGMEAAALSLHGPPASHQMTPQAAVRKNQTKATDARCKVQTEKAKTTWAPHFLSFPGAVHCLACNCLI